jgi:CubicO group peptidase (beta-lactamase class C family)
MRSTAEALETDDTQAPRACEAGDAQAPPGRDHRAMAPPPDASSDAESPSRERSSSPVPGARVDGVCDPAFAGVEAAFRENFESRNEIGAGVCLRIDGRTVVDLWGGHADAERTRAWERDTLVNAYSVGKGVTAMLVLSLVERGELDLDEKIAKVWPEFGVEGKADTTLRMLLAHRGGLTGVRRPLEAHVAYDWQAMAEALAEQSPDWTPGSAHGYHVNTFGFLVGEPVCRLLGLTFSESLRRRLTGPIDADFYVGLPDRLHARVAPIFEARSPDAAEPATSPVESARKHFMSDDAGADAERAALLARTYFNPPSLSGVGVVNSAPWRNASIPSTNGHGTARAVAELYDLFLNRDVSKGGLIGRGLREEAMSIQSDGIDRILGKPSRFGLGFQLAQSTRPIGRSEKGFGHFGYGGTLGFADPDAGLGFGYLMNRPGERWQTPRTNALVDAVYESLGAATLPELAKSREEGDDPATE